ncbi:MAG: hypothetical protein R3286_05935 [Gammaproteobacteria bacterium]|nr:hypothetical protein [Gammaproteobacteria bacterium]
MSTSQRVHLVAVALTLTLFNCIKPLHIDDAQYFIYAQQIARQPLDPYGFEIIWFQWPEPAMELLSPVLLSYWLAPAVAAFGDQTFLVKLWLLPFLLVLALAVLALAARFARGLEIPILWMCALSPTVLPAINLMLDVPSTALGLAAIALFARSCDRRSLVLALLSGLLAGLAMQTKYYALIVPGVILLYALVYGSLRRGIASAAVAGILFIGWELALHMRYAESHFLVQLTMHDPMRTPEPRWRMVLPLITNAGFLGIGVTALGVAALTQRRSVLGASVALAVLLIAWIALGWPQPLLAGAVLGLAFWTVVAACAVAARRTARDGASRAAVFLAAWLALEIAGYFVMAPFAAARRLIGIMIAASLLCAHAYGVRRPAGGDIRPVILAAVLSVVLGVSIAAVDLREALAGRRAVELAVERIRAQHGGGVVWFTGHWGFQHHARAAGMRELVPDHSIVARGDWLVLPLHGVVQQAVDLDASRLEVMDRIDVDDGVPLATVPYYYSGALPLAPRDRPRFTVALLRASADTTPRSSMPPQALIDWARARSGRGALGAAPALVAIAGDGRYREQVKDVLVEIGERALEVAVRSGDPALADWAREALRATVPAGARRDDGESRGAPDAR